MNDKEVYNKESVLQELLRTLFFTTKDGRKRVEFDQTEEVDFVINYLNKILDSGATVEEKGQILRQVKLFDKRELKEEYIEPIKQIKEKSSITSTLFERIHLLLTDEYFYLKDQLEPELLTIIELYPTWEVFIIDFVNVKKKLTLKELHSFWEALNIIIRTNKRGSKEMLEYVYTNERGLFHDFASLVRANYDDEDYFYSQVDRIWQLNEPASGRNVIWMLTHGRDDKHELFRERDFGYFDTILKNKDYEAIDRLCYSIGPYLYVNKTKTLRIISDLFQIEDKTKHIDHLIFTLLDHNQKIADEFKTEIRDVIFSSTLDIGINNHFYQYILTFLDNNFGFNEMLKYLERRIDHLQSRNEYLSFYIHETYKNSKLSNEQREDYFVNIVEWYLLVPSPKRLLHEKLVEFFRPGKIATESLIEKVKSLVKKYSSNSTLLFRIAESMHSFEDETREYILLCIYIAETYIKCPDYTPKELNKIFGSDILYNTGGRSKSGFGAFPQDIAKKDLLKQILADTPMSPIISDLLKKALEKVERDIKSEEEDDRLKW